MASEPRVKITSDYPSYPEVLTSTVDGPEAPRSPAMSSPSISVSRDAHDRQNLDGRAGNVIEDSNLTHSEPVLNKTGW